MGQPYGKPEDYTLKEDMYLFLKSVVQLLPSVALLLLILTLILIVA